ncbi:unnamed protein product [Spirodela intermedia]|uniref:HMA domain-containing protein n=1 Tax=Spirodela intermedia TaxID=51605 RepID=A0A7I8JVT2_SPIIN|nr:unnamed protein product [Spirodela intermedia]CAA6673562.1 unnamed protein product [Spirodela intermedia]
MNPGSRPLHSSLISQASVKDVPSLRAEDLAGLHLRRSPVVEASHTVFSLSKLTFLVFLPQTVELGVHMDCEGCEKRIRKAISKLEGVDSVEIDRDQQKVTVTGYVAPDKVLKLVRRTGRKAEFWPNPYDEEFHPYAAEYLEDSVFYSTYNYYQHGYNADTQGYFPDPPHSHVVGDDAAALFTDDNVHACAIM